MVVKKIIAISVILVLMVTALSACQTDEEPQIAGTPSDSIGAGDENSGIAAGPPEPSYWDILGARDFEGYAFTVLDANYNPDQWQNRAKQSTTRSSTAIC
jgi:hypothetical protein